MEISQEKSEADQEKTSADKYKVRTADGVVLLDKQLWPDLLGSPEPRKGDCMLQGISEEDMLAAEEINSEMNSDSLGEGGEGVWSQPENKWARGCEEEEDACGGSKEKCQAAEREHTGGSTHNLEGGSQLLQGSKVWCHYL